MKPLALSDEQLTAVMRTSLPIPPDARSAFLEAVVAVLQELPEIGDGLVGRVCAALQGRFLEPPPDLLDVG